MTQTGQHVQLAETHVVLQVEAGSVHLAVGERQGRDEIPELRRLGGAAVRFGVHAPEIDAKGKQMLRVGEPVGARIDAVGGELHRIEDDVASQPVGVGVDGALHFLPVDAHVDIQRLLARPLETVTGLVQAARLARRMRRDAADNRQPMRARCAGIPNVFITLLLERQAQLLCAVDAETVLADECARVIAGAVGAAHRRAVILLLRARYAEHQGMVVTGCVEHTRAAQPFAGGVVAEPRVKVHARLETRLRQPHVDGAAECTGAVEYGGRPFDDFDLFGQPHRHERGDRTDRLRGIQPHAVDQEHDAVLAQSANDRILSLRAVKHDRQAGFAAQRLADVLRLLVRQRLAREHRRGDRRFAIVGGVALGGDIDRG